MIVYTDTLEDVTPAKLHGFFEGWRREVTPPEHLEILQSSYAFVLAIDDDEDEVVGFVTAISDGKLAAYIPLLEVRPEYQGKGIGTELFRRMLETLDGLYMIDTICDEDLRDFYERFEMHPSRGMIKRA